MDDSGSLPSAVQKWRSNFFFSGCCNLALLTSFAWVCTAVPEKCSRGIDFRVHNHVILLWWYYGLLVGLIRLGLIFKNAVLSFIKKELVTMSKKHLLQLSHERKVRADQFWSTPFWQRGHQHHGQRITNVSLIKEATFWFCAGWQVGVSTWAAQQLGGLALLFGQLGYEKLYQLHHRDQSSAVNHDVSTHSQGIKYLIKMKPLWTINLKKNHYEPSFIHLWRRIFVFSLAQALCKIMGGA